MTVAVTALIGAGVFFGVLVLAYRLLRMTDTKS